MGVEEILTLVKAGFNAEQIQAMIPGEPKGSPREIKDFSLSQPQVEIKTEPVPEPVKEEVKIEEPKAEPEPKQTDTETSDLEAIKAELAEAKKQVTSLQTLLGSQDNSGGAARQTPEEYLSNIFKNFY
ncbi:MAG: hypothetical protein J6U97_02790 [Bacteroidaceae bacterium]|nr:hypothetical protein [Bacteroidaceae bacterium]